MTAVNDDRTAAARARQRLLEKLLREDGPTVPTATPGDGTTPPSRADGAVPLSSAQERLWFLEQLQPGTSAFNLPAIWHLDFAVDDAALAWSLNEIVRRHGILRTRLTVDQGQPLQAVMDEVDVTPTVVDLRGLPTDERDHAVEREISRFIAVPFDLGAGPPIRARLFRLRWTSNVLVLVVHHVACDGWSLEVLYRELGQLYNARADGLPSTLAELPLQYRDVAVAQRQWLASDDAARQLEYWATQLAGLEPLDLPTDRPRPPVQSSEGAYQSLALSREATTALAELCRREGATPFMALLAAYAAVLHRSTTRTDIAIGTPVAGRRRPELEPLVGLFLNTLVMRVTVDPGAGFRALLGHVRDVAVAAYDNQDVPFERVLAVLQPPRDLSRTPLFQAYFNLLNYGGGPNGIPATGVGEPQGTSAKFDLSLYAAEVDGCTRLTLVYATALFHDDTAAALLSALEHLLLAALAEPDAAVGTLPVRPRSCAAPAPRRPRGLVPAVPVLGFPEAATEQAIGARFEDVAAAHAERPAVITDRDEWTYAELDRRSRAVASALSASPPPSPSFGRGPGHGRVALLVGHDAGMVAAVLGVLRSGRAYVPLDPSHPPDRLAATLGDADVEALVADATSWPVARAAATRSGVPLLHLEALMEQEVGAAPLPVVGAEAVAYLLYTSGSTGRPKAVVQSHGNVLRHMRAYTGNLSIGPEDRLTLLSTYGFDAAVMDLFGALTTGAAVVPIDLREVGFGGALERLRRRRATVLHATPTVFRGLVAELQGGDPVTGVRAVVLGGEAVFRPDFEHFRACFAPPCVFVNGYGPTEATVCTQFVADHGTELTRSAVPIGLPLDGVEVQVVDELGNETPANVPGRLIIRSRQVALGYWRRPDLTAAAFAAAGGDGADGVREYRTGDRVRRQWDGTLVFEGRGDREVKIRGFRVDLGEVEAALLEVPGVREAVVVLDGAGPDASLAAFLTSSWPERRLASDVRRHLRRNVPAYLVPSSIVWLDELPRLSTGKLDRSRLVGPGGPRQAPLDDSSATTRPATPTERALAAIWAEVLGQGDIARSADFFADLGGHSLAAMRAVARITEQFHVALPLGALFEDPTLSGLANRIDRSAPRPTTEGSGPRSRQREVSRVRLEPGGRLRVLPTPARPPAPASPAAAPSGAHPDDAGES